MDCVKGNDEVNLIYSLLFRPSRITVSEKLIRDGLYFIPCKLFNNDITYLGVYINPNATTSEEYDWNAKVGRESTYLGYYVISMEKEDFTK